MKRLLVIVSLIWVSISVKAQIENPVQWSFSSEKINDKEAFLVLKANYVIVNGSGEQLVPAQAFDLDISNYVTFWIKEKRSLKTCKKFK